MKRIGILLFTLLSFGVAFAADLPDNVYFRAMKDEMQRSLEQLRLEDHPAPYYISYWLTHMYDVEIEASLGALVPSLYNAQDDGYMEATVFVSVGSDQQDSLGFVDTEWGYRRAEWGLGLFNAQTFLGYGTLRQRLWWLTDRAYLQAANLYQQKQNYKQKKNILSSLPDVVPSPSAQFVEKITPWTQPDIKGIQETVRQISALGKELPFVENFTANLLFKREDRYFLNSRGSFGQYIVPWQRMKLRVTFRQSDGKTSSMNYTFWLKDDSPAEMARARQEAQNLLARVRQAYAAPDGEAYVGPVLLKPRAAAAFLEESILRDLGKSKPLLLAYADEDKGAGKWYKKRHVRASTSLLTLYDRPLQRTFEGVSLARFFPLDDEGVAAENLTLVKDGYIQDLPLTQRPLLASHRSNGHAYIASQYGPREGLTNVFVEPKLIWTDQQMEEKLLSRCRELNLPYGYILHDDSPSGDLGIERIYTADGRKETVLNLKWDGNFASPRDLRNVLAVGGKSELVSNFSDKVIITPSILLQEAELVPQEHKPHRKPFLARPK